MAEREGFGAARFKTPNFSQQHCELWQSKLTDIKVLRTTVRYSPALGLSHRRPALTLILVFPREIQDQSCDARSNHHNGRNSTMKLYRCKCSTHCYETTSRDQNRPALKNKDY